MSATTAVKERPILFSGPMVRAILEGRKTQTRRVVNPQPPAPHLGYTMTAPGVATLCGPDYPDGADDEVRCPYGQPGDLLWVREAWGYFGGDEYLYQRELGSVGYRADHNPLHPIPGGKWRPSIHMPRWASRLTLEITRVRVERLQDISEEDALSEGVTTGDGVWSGSTRNAYRELWNSINAKRGLPWATNPWVWVIDFRRTTP